MFQPTTPVWGLLLLMMVHAAEAQPQAARGRSIFLASNPGAPLPEVLVALGRRTLILFDARIDKSSVQLDLSRFTLVDVGERSLLVEPVVRPENDEHAVMRVRYLDAGTPEWATLALVFHPTETDGQVEVVRPRLTLEQDQAEQARGQARDEDSPAAVWGLSDRLRGGSVQGLELRLKQAQGWAYRFEDGVLLVLQVDKSLVPQPWTPTGATLRNQADPKQEVKVHAVHVREGTLAPGEWSLVAVEAALPPPAARYFTLELRGTGGRRLVIAQVRFPPAPGKQGPGQ